MLFYYVECIVLGVGILRVRLARIIAAFSSGDDVFAVLRFVDNLFFPQVQLHRNLIAADILEVDSPFVSADFAELVDAPVVALHPVIAFDLELAVDFAVERHLIDLGILRTFDGIAGHFFHRLLVAVVAPFLCSHFMYNKKTDPGLSGLFPTFS